MATYSERVSSTNDDGYQVGTDTTFTTSGCYLGDTGGNDYATGLRWASVEIPQGSTITSATLTITWNGSFDGSGTITTTVYGSDIDSSSAWASSTNLPRSQTYTTANTVYATATDFSNNATSNIDVTSIIQEIVDRGGFVSGNALSLVLDSTASTNRRQSFYDVNNDGAKAALLTIQHSEAYSLDATTASFTLTGVNVSLNKALNLVAEVGNFALTGVSVALGRGVTMVASVGNFILTGLDATLTWLGWTNRTKPSTSWTNRTKPTTSFTDRTKPTTTWTKIDRY